MKIPIYQVDAFTSKLFAGNPAAVCILEDWLDDKILQQIAAENNLSETSYLVRNPDGYDLRWFTPTMEVALCGHATLAAAYVLFNERDWPQSVIKFQSRHSGVLEVTKENDLLTLHFPARTVHAIDAPPGLDHALGILLNKVFGAEEDLLVVLENEDAVKKVTPDFASLEKVPCRGVIITAPGDDCDFVSRFFAPRAGIPEDPVTGSAHCALAPYWADILGKKIQNARQVSERGGELFCEVRGDRVLISGRAVLYLKGMIHL